MQDAFIVMSIMAVPIVAIVGNYVIRLKRMQLESQKQPQTSTGEISLSGQSIEVMQNLVDEIRSVRTDYKQVQERLTRIESQLGISAAPMHADMHLQQLPPQVQIK